MWCVFGKAEKTTHISVVFDFLTLNKNSFGGKKTKQTIAVLTPNPQFRRRKSSPCPPGLSFPSLFVCDVIKARQMCQENLTKVQFSKHKPLINILTLSVSSQLPPRSWWFRVRTSHATRSLCSGRTRQTNGVIRSMRSKYYEKVNVLVFICHILKHKILGALFL